MGRGSSKINNTGGSSSIANHTFSLPKSEVSAGKVTKRAEEVFNREYTNLRSLARRAIEDGDYNVGGFASLHSDDNEAVFSKPLLRGMQSKINSEWKGLDIDEKLGVGNSENRQIRRYALTMMQRMLNKYYTSMYVE